VTIVLPRENGLFIWFSSALVFIVVCVFLLV
jgi:hypothetical protein